MEKLVLTLPLKSWRNETKLTRNNPGFPGKWKTCPEMVSNNRSHERRITRRSFVRTTGTAAGLAPFASSMSALVADAGRMDGGGAHLPKNPAKPEARLIELREDGHVYWRNQRIEKDAKIPEYE